MAARKISYSFLLLALIAFKVCSATIHISLHHHHDHAHHCNHDHDTDHDDDHEDSCELCEQAMSILNEEFSSAQKVLFPERQQQLPYNRQINNCQNVCTATFFNNTLLVRPPPTLL